MKNQNLFIILSLILCSCAITKNPAPIEYNHDGSSPRSSNKTIPTLDDSGEVIDQGSFEVKQTEIITQGDDENFIIPNQTPGESNRKFIYHEVQVGETIEDIASQYEQRVADIASLNDLAPPYYLDEFQVLKINATKKVAPLITEASNEGVIESVATTKPAIEAQKPVEKLDYISPLQGKIITKFGEKTNLGVNKGVSIAAKPGTKVLATADGKVIYADYDATFGNLVIIKLNNKNIVASYAHLQDIILSKGTSVKQGDVVGYVGSTGKVKQPQLHFGIREGKIAKDPGNFVKF
ncbi:MAG: hypothetical protein Tsb006_6470 [Rickettsiaceae bacterium]